MLNKVVKTDYDALLQYVEKMNEKPFNFQNLRRKISPFVKTSEFTKDIFTLSLKFKYFGIKILIDEEDSYFYIYCQNHQVYGTPITTNKNLMNFIIKHQLLTLCPKK